MSKRGSVSIKGPLEEPLLAGPRFQGRHIALMPSHERDASPFGDETKYHTASFKRF